METNPTRQMMELPNIKIYYTELEVILSQENEDLQKILFVMLVWSKMNPFNVVTVDDRMIAKYIRVMHMSRMRMRELIDPVTSETDKTEGYLLQHRVYITSKGSERHYYQVLFAEQNDSLKHKFIVNKLDTSIYHFIDELKKYDRCVECGSKLFKTGKNQKYCNNCQKKMKKIYHNQKCKEYRARQREIKLREKQLLREEEILKENMDSMESLGEINDGSKEEKEESKA